LSDLKNRLRGIYKLGDGTEFEDRSFAEFIPPISLEAANEIERLEGILSKSEKLIAHVAAGNFLGFEGDKLLLEYEKSIKDVEPDVNLKTGNKS